MSVYECDLHCHTTNSDGNDTPFELVDNAVAAGLKVLGLVDHDVLPPGPEIEEYAEKKGLKLVRGYEFSCDTRVDDVHICGYKLDWGSPQLLAEVEAAAGSKSDAYYQLTVLLTENGMPVDWERDILAGIRTPDEVQRKHIFEAMAARGYAASWSDAKVLVRDNPLFNVRRRKIDPLDAIGLIHDCGGIAILAHPYLIDEQPGDGRSRSEYIDCLIANGLDGIEASYTYDKTSYTGKLTPEEIECAVRRNYHGRIRYFSGGSDYHADHKKGTVNARRIGERGITMEEFKKIGELQ